MPAWRRAWASWLSGLDFGAGPACCWWTIRGCCSSVAYGPKLVLPRSLPPALSAADMDQVVLHELAHLRRGDLYWGWTIELARIVYFFHPLVYWVGYCLQLERELACDQVAMAVSGQMAGDYAQTLVRVVSHGAAGEASESTTTGNRQS
jgi:beta-lactamase regulating signal transducer with metallopeptidase domain